jgi:hypothetical protein
MSETPRNVPGVVVPPPHAVNGVANPNVRHERTDVDTRAVLWFVAGLAGSLAAVMLALWGLFALLLRNEAREKTSDDPRAVEQRNLPLAERLPPAPRLEGVSVQGLEQPTGRIYPPDLDAQHDVGRIRASSAKVLYDQQERELNGLGWIPGAKGQVAHIPIEQAMRQLAGKLPARAGSKARERSEFLDEPTGSSSGRVPRGGSE